MPRSRLPGSIASDESRIADYYPPDGDLFFYFEDDMVVEVFGPGDPGSGPPEDLALAFLEALGVSSASDLSATG